jgi:transposase-like protein
VIARRLRRRRPRPSDRWHLDEMVVRIAGNRMYLWRAVDHEGEVLDVLVQSRRDSRAALRLMRKLLRKQGFVPKLLVTDKLSSYGSAAVTEERLFHSLRDQTAACCAASVAWLAYSFPSRSSMRPARLCREMAAPTWFGRAPLQAEAISCCVLPVAKAST